MNNKKNTVVFLAIVFTFPVLLAFTLEDTMQQRWWQRKKTETPPMEFSTLQQEQGHLLEIHFKPGKSHNHPLMAFWIEDTTGQYLQSLYVAESIAKGYFRHGDASTGRWQPGPLRRPAALPYWGHQRGIKAPDGYYIPTTEKPMPDAVSGPTPKGAFILSTQVGKNIPETFNIFMEINQSWDWNHYWHNNKFPDDEYYRTSSQPALVYKVTVNLSDANDTYVFEPVGHSHWSGESGELFEDLSTITTALDITQEVYVRVLRD